MNKIFRAVKETLKKGIPKKRLVRSVAVGFTGGVFPVLGTTTILCTLLAIVSRTNWAIVQLINWLVYPLQLIFILPFMRLGAIIFSGQHYQGTLEEIVTVFKSGILPGLKHFGMVYLEAVIIWCILAIPIFLLILMLSNLLYSTIRKLLDRYFKTAGEVVPEE